MYQISQFRRPSLGFGTSIKPCHCVGWKTVSKSPENCEDEHRLFKLTLSRKIQYIPYSSHPWLKTDHNFWNFFIFNFFLDSVGCLLSLYRALFLKTLVRVFSVQYNTWDTNMVPVELVPQKVTLQSLKPPDATVSKSRNVPIHSVAATLWGHLPKPIFINSP